MIIKKIKKLRNGKYEINFDNGEKIITYDDVILKNNLLYNKEIDSKVYNELNKENNYYSIYSTLVKKLTKKMCSKKEFFKYIEKYNLSEKDKKQLINDLEKISLLNDMTYLKAYIADSFNLTNDGPLKIKKNLLEHDIDEFAIDNEMARISDEEIEEKAKKIVNKKLKLSKGSNYMVKQKIYQEMNILGYKREIIDMCFENEYDDSANLNKDFNKCYITIAKKEKDLEKLYFKIKQKLYQKGYSIIEIDNLINEKRINN